MGDYISYNELLTRYPLIKKWHEGKETLVNSYLIYYSESQLNSLLASHFSTPFSAAHPTIKDLTLDLCRYRVLMDQAPEKSKEYKDLIIGRINDIKKGNEYIFTGSGTTIAPSAPGAEIWSNTMDYNATHTMLDDDSAYTMIDSQHLYDLEQERT